RGEIDGIVVTARSSAGIRERGGHQALRVGEGAGDGHASSQGDGTGKVPVVAGGAGLGPAGKHSFRYRIAARRQCAAILGTAVFQRERSPTVVTGRERKAGGGIAGRVAGAAAVAGIRHLGDAVNLEVEFAGIFGLRLPLVAAM